MKLELTEYGIELIPENFADKLYIARFVKELNKNFPDISNIEASFNTEKRCGYCDPDKIVESQYEAEEATEGDKIATESINRLSITTF